jgi:hypothetical protein
MCRVWLQVLSKVEEANQVGRKLPPDGFYNQLISEKMDVQDHYTAWRQTQEQPSRRHGNDGPFSFCSYPFLLDPRAKSNLLHIEARFQMEQVRGMGAGRGVVGTAHSAAGQFRHCSTAYRYRSTAQG